MTASDNSIINKHEKVDNGISSSSKENNSSEELINGKPKYEVTWNDMNKFKYYAYGFVASTATQIVFYPFELIKTHQQVHRDSHLSQVSILRNLVKQASVRALYRGFLVSWAGLLTSENLYMSTYEVANQQLVDRMGLTTRYLLAGFSADVVANVLVVPFDVIAQRRMISHDRSVTHIVKEIIHKEGMKGLFRGYGMTMAKYAPESAVWWTQYGLIRNFYFNQLGEEEKTNHLFKHQILSSGLGGLVAGLSCAILFNPMDVIKTRLQTSGEKISVLKLIRDLKKQEGWKGFTKGILPNTIFMSSTSALSIAVYEMVKIMSQE